MNALTATGLGAIRGDRIVFRGIDLSARRGDLVLIRGANGSGKTTLLRLLAGFARPDAGHVTRIRFHWLGHTNGLKPHESPRAHLALWARAWGSSRAFSPLLKDFGLTHAADVPARSLSAGQKRRTALARLLLTDRPLWLLDEPFAALDSEGCKQVTTLIDAHLAGGGTVCAAVHGDVPLRPSLELQL